MNYIKLFFCTAAGLSLATTASAQTIAIGSTKGGAVAQITATISKAVSEHGGVQMRKQTMGGTQQYIPVVNAGELEFGISNIAQYHMARTGTMLSKKGGPYKNLRLVSTMMKFQVSPVVGLKSGITKTSQLKGTRMATGFKGAPLFVNIHNGALATANLTPSDIKSVPQVGLVQHWRSFMAGKIDWAIAAAGSGFVKQMQAKIDGGIRHISFPNTPEALAKMRKHFPMVEWVTIAPRKGLTGVVEPTTFVAYDYLLWTHKGLSNDTVYKVTKVMHTQGKQLKQGGPLWNTFKANNRLAKPQGHPYHPGAVKYYKEAGIWPSK